jgi:hypothetical protein
VHIWDGNNTFRISENLINLPPDNVEIVTLAVCEPQSVILKKEGIYLNIHEQSESLEGG